MHEEDDPKSIHHARKDAAEALAGEDLDPYSQDELAQRIALLEAELARVREHSVRANATRAAADALFGGGSGSGGGFGGGSGSPDK